MIKSLTGGNVAADVMLKSKVKDQILKTLSQQNISYDLSSDQRVNQVFSQIDEEVAVLNQKLHKPVF